MKYFVFADPHGDYSAFMDAIVDMGYNPSNPQHQLVGCGDYFGRASNAGADCVNIWNYLCSPHHTNPPICLRGNHESILLDAIYRGGLTSLDIRNGEHKTFASFVDVFEEQIKYDPYLQYDAVKQMRQVGFVGWLESLPWYFETKHFLFVHGFVPMKYFINGGNLKDFENYDWDRASWSRTPEDILAVDSLDSTPPKTLVFGHWRAKDLRRKFLGIDDEDDGEIYIDEKRKFVGLDATTILSHKVGHIVLEDWIKVK